MVTADLKRTYYIFYSVCIYIYIYEIDNGHLTFDKQIISYKGIFGIHDVIYIYTLYFRYWDYDDMSHETMISLWNYDNIGIMVTAVATEPC